MKKTITIKGMGCNNCKCAVERVLSALAGPDSSVSVVLESGVATIDSSHEISDVLIRQEIEKAGFEVTNIQ